MWNAFTIIFILGALNSKPDQWTMKNKIVFFALTIFSIGRGYGQNYAVANYVFKVSGPFYSSINTNKAKTKFHFCSESKVGFGITGVGIIVGVIGIREYYANDTHAYSGSSRNEKIGTGIWLVGGVLAIMGSVLAIDGSVHDMRRFSKQRKFTLISKGNDLGLVYNF